MSTLILTPIKRTVTDNVPLNTYLASFEVIWGTSCNPGEHEDCLEHGCLDNEPDHIAEIEPTVERVTRDNYLSLGVLGMTFGTNTDNRYDDTHDLRPRLFKTETEAKQHAEYTLNRFHNPQPWESFVKY